jgi:outer membrane receptor for ferrienterochelin and colicin
LRRSLTSLLLFLIPFSIALSGTNGKIAGNVKDAKTGEPLIGANVRLEGTSFGGSTDIEGNYFIINIPPNDYALNVTMVGYGPKKITDVRVRGDLTTTIDATLSETVLEIDQEVVVVGERPIVQKDLTAKTAIVTGKDISIMPVSEVGAVVSMQAGFVGKNLRGGRSGEVAYWIDGVPLNDSYDGTQVVEVNKNLVQELQVVSGAFNAEYGQAMSGIVNIASKEGGSKFTGSLGIYGGDYATSSTDLFHGMSFSPTNIRNIEGSFSGPIIEDYLTFFTNARYIYFNNYINGYRRFKTNNIGYTDTKQQFHISRDPETGLGDNAVVPLAWSKRTYLQGKMTLKVSPTMKLTGNYFYDYTTDKGYANDRRYSRQYFYDPDGLGNSYTTSHTAIFQFTHTISNSTFYTIGASLFNKNIKYHLYELEYRDSVDQSGNLVGTFEVWNPSGPHYVHNDLTIKADGWSFNTGGTDRNVNDRTTTTLLIKGDLTSQIDQLNMVKAGVEIKRHKLQLNNYQVMPVDSQATFNSATSSPYIRTYIPDISSQYHDTYERRPMEYAAYVQDKMEFKDVIVNLGVRFDYFEPDGVVLRDPSDPSIFNPIKKANRFHDSNGNGIQDVGESDVTIAERNSYWYQKATAKWAISPRLGVSFPITASGIVHFSYGHFIQMPRFERLYENPFFKLASGTGNVGIVGNSDLKPEQTVSGEIGVQQQISEDIALDVTAYMRDMRNLTGTNGEEIEVFGGASKYSRYTNNDFGFVRGIVLTIDKRFSNGFNTTLDYTFQIAKGSSSNPDDARKLIAGGTLPDIQLNSLEWDQRHTVNVTLGYTADVWGASAISQFGTGKPYTPRSSTDVSTILTYSQTKPTFFNLDIRAYYTLNLPPVNLVFFANIYNLFDTRNETDVYDDSGRSGFTIDEHYAYDTRPNEYVNTVSEWYKDPTRYSEPRRVEFGINLEF